MYSKGNCEAFADTYNLVFPFITLLPWATAFSCVDKLINLNARDATCIYLYQKRYTVVRYENRVISEGAIVIVERF